jgi:hypothetical protein
VLDTRLFRDTQIAVRELALSDGDNAPYQPLREVDSDIYIHTRAERGLSVCDVSRESWLLTKDARS